MSALAKKKIMVLVHASWCPHCVRFMPTWKRVERKLQESGQAYSLDLEESERDVRLPAILKMLGARGYPSLYLVDVANNKWEPYKDERTYENLVRFATAT